MSVVAGRSHFDKPLDTEVNRPPATIWWILSVSFLVQCLVLQNYNWFPELRSFLAPDPVEDIFLISVLWGTCGSLIILVAFFGVWAPIKWPLRIALTFFASACVTFIFCYDSDVRIAVWTLAGIILACFLGYISLLIIIAWLTKITLRHVDMQQLFEPNTSTFSLRYLGILATVIAVALAFTRGLLGNQTLEQFSADSSAIIQVCLEIATLFSLNFLVTIPVVVCTLSMREWLVLASLLLVVPLTLLETMILTQFSGFSDPFAWIFILCINAVQVIWIMATFGLLRRAGFRLVRTIPMSAT